jgi:hypothetical protein
MSWTNQLNGDSLAWLLEPDSPGVRYLALRDLLELPVDDPGLQSARTAAHEQGPIAAILAEMDKEGFWAEPGPGYNPKYRSTVWALIMLAQLGASASEDQRIARGCAYLLEHALAAGGQFSTTGAPSGTIDCLQGNLCWALLELDYQDPRLEPAFAWMARSVTGEGVAPLTDKHADIRYYAGKCGPTFACGANNKLPCAWGATKVLLAFSKIREERRTPLIQKAIDHGVDFIFGSDPARADYPAGWSEKPSQNWWKFGFPLFYITDLLQLVDALIRLGFGRDSRLENALSLIKKKQDEQGRWPLEYAYSGKTWVDCGEKKKPSKWITLRALKVLKASAE